MGFESGAFVATNEYSIRLHVGSLFLNYLNKSYSLIFVSISIFIFNYNGLATAG